LRLRVVLPALFTLTIFVSAGLLFLVQPMLARMVLPLFGGTPAVWNTCMVFFQAVLLAGYAYAHAGPALLGDRPHAVLHLAVLALPLLVLPLAVPGSWQVPYTSYPVLWLLGLLAVTAGLPFFAISCNAPLLQRWFAGTGHPSARDPYFLYAASNFGSLLALLGYPFVIEPTLRLTDQSRLWSLGYGLLVALAAVCAVSLLLSGVRHPGQEQVAKGQEKKTKNDRGNSSRTPDSRLPGRAPASRPLTPERKLRWVLLAFVPSSLTLSVTTYLTTDIAAIPLLWVVPLAIYLLTFVLVFARRPPVPHAFLLRWMPLVVLLIAIVLLSEATEPIGVVIGLHLLGLFWVGMVCHGELARDRPPGDRLTEFYLWMAVGGVLGGLFNALLAPLVFQSVVEYPLVLVLACLLRPRQGPVTGPDLALPLVLGAATAGLALAVQALGVESGPVSVALIFAVPAVLCYTFHSRTAMFGLGLGALLLAGSLYQGVHGSTQYRKRSFFGVHRVTVNPERGFRELVHGNTVHGRQRLAPAQRGVPLTYYHRTGPIGQVFKVFADDPRLDDVGVVGLGAGSLACYGRVGQRWTFYEIDPAVEQIAGGLFTFYGDCPAEKQIVLGDARLTLACADARHGLLVVDAFSSDAIPAHLLTREALQVYRSRLADDGLLAFNISNRYLELEPVLAALAADAQPPLVCLARQDRSLSQEEEAEGKSPSHWVVLATRAEDVARLKQAGWSGSRPRPGVAVWTDDYCNLWGAFRWEDER
jgi:hypothetical protein